MNLALTVYFYSALVVVILLSLCIIYLVFVYRKLLDKYTALSIDKDRKEVSNAIKIDANNFVSRKIDSALDKATDEAILLIGKNAKNMATSMRRKTIEKLMEDEKAEEIAVVAEYNEAKKDIEDYKAQELEKLRKNISEILSKVMPEILSQSLNSEAQEKLIMSELENAKRQLF